MWALPAATIAAIIPGWVTMTVQHTADWSDSDIGALIVMAGRLEARPLDLAGCWMSESGLSSVAHNANGNAAGIFQAMPATLQGLGYQDDWKAFTALPIAAQLHWAERYYAPHRGRLVSPGACYLATFLPALMAHADEPTYVLCGRFGPHELWYRANSGLDVNKDGWIKVQDLTDRIEQVTRGPRWDEFANRVRDVAQDVDTLPEPVAIDLTEEFPGDGPEGGEAA
jgi:hypothetical protein